MQRGGLRLRRQYAHTEEPAGSSNRLIAPTKRHLSLPSLCNEPGESVVYLFSKCRQQRVVGAEWGRSLGPLFDHLRGHPDQTRHLQIEEYK